MSQITAFTYIPGKTILHGLDVRFKLIFLVLISLTCLKASSIALVCMGLFFYILLKQINISIRLIFKDLRFILFFLVFVFAARALSTPGSEIIGWKMFVITREGICSGAIICLRLLMVILSGLLFVSTTKISEIKNAVQWFLNPVPFIPAKRMAVMMSLLIRFIPVIFEQAKEIGDAQRARCVENRKNPVYRLKKLIIPMMRRIFDRADKLAVAMEARCYSENRTDPGLSVNRKDWLAFFIVLSACLIILA